MNKGGIHIENQGHLTESQLIQYSEGTMTDAEMHQVEMHLLSCALCSDALEGIELLDSETKNTSLIALRSRFQSKLRNNSRAPKVAYWKWAAVAAIFLLSSVTLFVLLENSNTGSPEVATKESMENKNLPAMEPKPQLELEKDSQVHINNFAIDNAIALTREQKTSESIRKIENINPNTANEEREIDKEIPTAAVPQEEVLESLAFMKEAAEMDSNVEVSMPDSINVGEKLAGRVMGLEYSKEARMRLDKYVSGIVLDEGGNPVPGASIFVKGTDIGDISDVDGGYTISIPDSAFSLLISGIGYVTEEIDLDGTDTALTTTLTPDVTALSEVVVIGYSTQEKRDMTGSVASVKSRKLPEPAIGNRKFNKYLRENLTTESATQAGVEGSLAISFSVNKDGSLADFKIITPIGFGLEDKAIQLIEEGPEWVPASIGDGDAPVSEKVVLNIPVKIKKNK